MDELALQFFPYPHVFKGVRRNGFLLEYLPRCSGCDRQCESAAPTELGLCSYGVNFRRVDADLLINGVVVKDDPRSTPARNKQLKLSQNQVTRAQVDAVVARAQQSTEEMEKALAADRARVIAEYRGSRRYQTEIVDLLRPEIEKALGQVHDYKSFVAQIIQNMNVIWLDRYREGEIEDFIQTAPKEEVAIYHAARLMEDRLDAALFLIYPERITELQSRTGFRLHRLVHKTVRIFESGFESKGLNLHFDGESVHAIEGNYRAVSTIPHCLIDNALKYAPRDSDVYVNVSDVDGEIVFSVRSLGPRIDDDEGDLIFDVFYRGRSARDGGTEGTGFGLALASNVVRAMGTKIDVEQDRHGDENGNHWTTFSVRFPALPLSQREGAARPKQR